MAKIWTEEERKAFGEKMKASRAAKTNTPQPTEPVEATPSEPTVNLTQDQFQALMERLNKLETSKTETLETKPLPNSNQASIDNLGRTIGIMTKYSVNPDDYEDPREKLMSTPALERFAFRTNYFLKWDVEQTIYETKFGTSYAEPRFELRLYKRLFEDDGTPTPDVDKATGIQRLDEQGRPQFKSYLVTKGFFFEDPAASLKEAVQMGLPVNNANSKEFLKQMRELRYQSWLLEVFNKPRTTSKPNKESMVIGSSVVTVESYSEVA